MNIIIQVDDITVEAELFDTKTARAIYQTLPLEAQVLTWGEEIYFEVPVNMELDETAQEIVEAGDLGYWPTGRAMCLFFGPTPVSAPGEIKPASAVNIIGRLQGDLEVLKKVPAGMEIKVSKY